jgi:hypothetical protein
MKFILLLGGLCFSLLCQAQYVYTIKADSVKITNSCDTAEFILENHTMTVPGFLFNTGRGRTVFKRALQKINDSLYLIGADTLKVTQGFSGVWRISPIDSLGKSPNGLQANGINLVPNTVDNTYPGMMTPLQKREYDSIYNGWKIDTIRLLYGGLGTSLGYIAGRDSIILKTLRAGSGITVTTLMDSSILYAVDTGQLATTAHLYKAVDSIGSLIGSGSVTQVSSGYGLAGGPITSIGTLQVDTAAMATTALVRKVADSAAAVAKPPVGFNVQFLYGTGGSAIPKKNSDSVYSNPGLSGNNVQVYLNGSMTSMMLVDSATWALTGSNPLTPYFRYNKSIGRITFCNFGNVSGLVNGAFAVSIFAGPQGFPALTDTGGGTLLPPVVNAGSSQTISVPSNSATLVGSATSPNSGGSVVSYSWSFVSGPETPTLSTPNSQVTSVSGMDSLGNYLFSLSATDNGGRQGTGQTTVTVSSGEAVSYSPSSLSGFTTFLGYQSPAQTFFVSGVHLGTQTVTVTAPTGYVLSLDSSTWTTFVNLTPSAGSLQSTKLYLAISATASAGAAGGYVAVAATGASTQLMPVSGTVQSLPSNEARYNFSSVPSAVPGWTNMYGSPQNGLTVSSSNTGWTLTTVGFTANWQTLGGNNGDGPVTDAPDSSYSALFPSDVWHSGDMWNPYEPFEGSNYGFQFTNLPAGSYTIQIMGRIPNSQHWNNSGPASYHIQFGTGADQSALLFVQNNYTQYLTFTGTITAGQTIQFGTFEDNELGGGSVGWITGLIITKN